MLGGLLIYVRVARNSTKDLSTVSKIGQFSGAIIMKNHENVACQKTMRYNLISTLRQEGFAAKVIGTIGYRTPWRSIFWVLLLGF